MFSWRNALLAMGLSVLLTGGMCGDDETKTTDGGPTPDTLDTDSGSPDSAPPPDFVKFHKAGETAEVTSTAANTWLIVPYSVSTQEASAIDYTIKVEAKIGSTSYPLKMRRRVPLSVRNPALWAKWQRRLAVEAWTHGVRLQASHSPMSLPDALIQKRLQGMNKTFAACTKSSECGTDEVCHGGSCEKVLTLNVEKFAPTAKEITATVKRKGDHTAIIVDNKATVDERDLDDLIDMFDKTIYQRDVSLFGNPPLKSGETTLSSDRNADGLIWMVITNTVSEVRPAVGFFVATDFTDDALSNKADILWMTPPETAGELTPAYTTMAHEFQHLLNYAVKVYKPAASGGSAGDLEALWLDEGLSHFAEDACGFGGENTTMLSQETFTAFNTTALISGQDSLAARGVAFTYVRYLFEKKGAASYETSGAITDGGGAAWLKSLHASTKTGAENITATYGDYKAAMDAWIATIAIDGRGMSGADLYSYKSLIDDPVTHHQIGLKIRGSRKDATGAETTLEGPLEEDAKVGDNAGTIANATGNFYKLPGQDGTMKITLTTQESDMRFVVIKLK